MSNEEVIKEAGRYMMNTYNRFPVVFVKGRGTRLYDQEGREYLDFVAGIGVNNLGHCNHRVTVAIQKQVQRLMHVSNLYYNEPQVSLARLLVKHSFADQVFFCNSGAEANEAAIKLARKAGKARGGSDRYEIITMENSFHGRTLATLTATGQEKLKAGFEPLVPGFKSVPYNDITAVEKAIDHKTAAILVEPIQGESGVQVPRDDYLLGLRKLCDEHGLFLILDEVQTGMGRTGRLFAYEHSGIQPDMVTLAKGLGNGFPIGALLAKAQVAEAFSPGSHASTFGGNPVACAAAIAVMETFFGDDHLLENCQRMGEYLVRQLNKLAQKYAFVRAVRGKGLLIGMELGLEGRQIASECLTEGVVVNCTAEKVLRFLPPLIITQEEIDRLIAVLDRIFQRRAA
ncbi:MAG TPA: acetylornithine transaminase [Nitrospiria bacterium]|nr:acetylornithine transaminase [Nitrospiria bacterium]